MSNTEWLESLKVGDEVAINSRDGYSIKNVTNITKTQICTEYSRYRKKDGRSVGSCDWYVSNIEPVTDKIKNIVTRSRISAQLRKQDFTGLSLDQLERIKSIIDEGKQ